MQRSFVAVLGLWLSLMAGALPAQGQMVISGELVEVVLLRDTIAQQVIRSPELFREGWHTLPQVRFWRRIMRLNPEYSLLSVAETREILLEFPTDYYERLSSSQKQAFKDSILQAKGLPSNSRLYVTFGKSDFYRFDRAMPSIHRGIQVFLHERVDPWYAQSILLIESPGANRHSSVGAAGQFQLMRDVAIAQGLTVNSRVDERLDFDMAARGAARHLRNVALPQTRNMLHEQGIRFRENDLWFRLLVLHVYHAGAGNVRGALRRVNPTSGGMELVRELWTTHYRGFQNASQNYSQLALAALVELEVIVRKDCEIICADTRRM